MKYVVIYDSETGNTAKVAKAIYGSIESAEKVLINLDETKEIPLADTYFVGFPIHRQSCGLKIMEVLEELEEGNLAMFATCGMMPTEKYKQKLEESLNIWICDSVNYLGMYLCQGGTTTKQKAVFLKTSAEHKDQMSRILENGNNHPDQLDLREAVEFALQIQDMLE